MLLFSLFVLCGVAFLVAHKLRERLPPPEPRLLFAVVSQQLSALRADDFRSAYRHAATGVQQRFTLGQFEKMARRSFPEIAQAHRVEFGEVKVVEEGNALVEVFFFATDGSMRAFVYSLVEENGAWRIDNVEEVRRSRRRAVSTNLHA